MASAAFVRHGTLRPAQNQASATGCLRLILEPLCVGCSANTHQSCCSALFQSDKHCVTMPADGSSGGCSRRGA